MIIIIIILSYAVLQGYKKVSATDFITTLQLHISLYYTNIYNCCISISSNVMYTQTCDQTIKNY